ncbi:MAG: hypothetical protein HN726_00020 [Candidatus Magasanikbacteria bacterium]|nr:hypothetical protein [Candidatus Magasanikbacteria bacterium]
MAPWEGAAFSAGVRPQDLEEGERQDDNPLEPEVPEDLSGQVEHLQALMERSEGGDGGFSERPKATVMRNPTINK